ncbi:MAG: MYG1 family protein [Chlamydiota bacterium]|jgi:uncharacterized UPF0160 family protein
MQPRSFGTHDGSFHADEVTACSLLLLVDLIDRDKIHRTRDPKILAKCEYVCDVGGVYDPQIKRFDHHQVDYQGSLSSAGMILNYLKEKEFVSQSFYNFLNHSLIKGVDAHDNGVEMCQDGVTSFSDVVSNFLPIDYNSNAKERFYAFLEAAEFVFSHLKRLRNRFLYTKECKDKVKEAMAKNKLYLEFDDPLPWIDNFFDLKGEGHPALYVIMPTGEHWKLRGIPPSSKDRMKVRLPLPKKWAGLRDHELQQASGIEGAIFCHKGQFISIWENKKDAFAAMHKIFKEHGITEK